MGQSLQHALVGVSANRLLGYPRVPHHLQAICQVRRELPAHQPVRGSSPRNDGDLFAPIRGGAFRRSARKIL